MLNHLVLAEVKNAMLGNIILVSGSILLLLFLLKHFAWDAISSMMQKREKKSPMIWIQRNNPA
ncbi:ATP synthase B chain [Enterococcus sp. HSIEG1]|nr:ATP synthase B chain [Enterococcus sp. HSIEG1]